MQDKNCQAGCIYELFGMQGAENIASQLTNKKICLIMQRLIANICGLWSSQKGEATSPCWSSSWGRMHKIHREIGGCRVTRREDGSARLTFQKRGKVSKREYEEQLAGTKDDFTALQEITTAIKSALSFLEE